MAAPVQMIHRYRVIRRLGVGGMGEVLLAEDTELERLVALKVLSRELAHEPEHRSRFRDEAKAASALAHPNICVIHEVGETEDGRPFLAMEYVEGETIEVRSRRRRFTAAEIVRLGLEVAEALEAAHGHGMIHRDIKPANLMLDQRGHAKVLDFGLAKRFAADDLAAPPSLVAHTQTGVLIGTPSYMSPEQVLGHELDSRADLFSLGVVLYELVVGQRPFLGQTLGETMNSVVNQPAAPFGANRESVPPRLEEIVLKCLEKDPAHRYASAGELAAELRALQHDTERVPPAASSAASSEPMRPAATRSEPTRLWQLVARMHGGPRRWWRWSFGVVAAVMLVAGVGWLMRKSDSATRTPTDAPGGRGSEPSVAVLPFENPAGAKEDEYLGDGISEEIITALSKIPGFKVPARASCFAFKGRNPDLKKVARQLRVRTVLEGSISRTGNRLHVTARLSNVADGFYLWSETFDGTLDDLLAIRLKVAAGVAEALKGQLLGDDRQKLAGSTTENAVAYRLYLEGRFLWNRRTAENLKQAIEHFNQAIAEDPGYALAYAGLADCFVVLSQYTGLPTRETFPKARAAAQRALELAPHLGEPHATLGFIRAFFDWDWPGAEAEFQRAVELAPNYATAHHWFARALDAMGRQAQALAEGRRAQEIDPLSPVINANLGLELYLNGKNEEAAETLRAQLELDPNFFVAHDGLGLVYLQQGRFAEAVAEFESMHRLDSTGTYGLGNLGFGYARAGRTNDARTVLRNMTELQQTLGRDCRVAMALVKHGLGEDDSALTLLEEAAADRASGVEWLNFAPVWRDLAQQPRAREILKRMNLAP